MYRFDKIINSLLSFIFPISNTEDLSDLRTCAKLRELQIKDHIIYYTYKYRKASIRKVLLDMKNKGPHEYVDFFADSIHYAILELLEERLSWESLNITVCPIPLHRRKRAKRGFDQNIVIAKSLKNKLDEKSKIQINTKLLKRIKNTKEQKKLKKKERFENLKNAFQVSDRSALDKVDIIIIFDDITTSGATLLSAKSALRKAGFKGEVIMISIAH